MSLLISWLGSVMGPPHKEKHRLHVAGCREHVHGTGPRSLIAKAREDLHIPSQGGRVAGDIDYPLRRHPCDGGNHRRTESLSRRVYSDNVRPESLSFQLDRHLRCIAAEKLCIFNMVARRVFPGVCDGGGYNLCANNPF